MDPWDKSLNFIFPTKHVIPESLKFSHWLSELSFGGFPGHPFFRHILGVGKLPLHKPYPAYIGDAHPCSRCTPPCSRPTHPCSRPIKKLLCRFHSAFNKLSWPINTYNTVDGSEIRPSPVEVGSLSHYLHYFWHPRWFLGFLPSAVSKKNCFESKPTIFRGFF